MVCVSNVNELKNLFFLEYFINNKKLRTTFCFKFYNYLEIVFVKINEILNKYKTFFFKLPINDWDLYTSNHKSHSFDFDL